MHRMSQGHQFPPPQDQHMRQLPFSTWKLVNCWSSQQQSLIPPRINTWGNHLFMQKLKLTVDPLNSNHWLTPPTNFDFQIFNILMHMSVTSCILSISPWNWQSQFSTSNAKFWNQARLGQIKFKPMKYLNTCRGQVTCVGSSMLAWVKPSVWFWVNLS